MPASRRAVFIVLALALASAMLWAGRTLERPRVLTVELAPVEIIARAEPAPVEDVYADLRARLRWKAMQVGREVLVALDHESRMLLARSAAEQAGLEELGLSHKDVYAIINAETSWAPRTGRSRNGTPNLGIAQFEPATAKALGVQDPDDAVESVHAAARHIREAALWSRDRIKGLKLGKAERAEKLREGISIYYNLSTRGRNQWTGTNTADLPVETQRHILNARMGAQEAEWLDAQLKAARRT